MSNATKQYLVFGRFKRSAPLLSVTKLILGVIMSGFINQSFSEMNVRKAAVAGQFYPADAVKLREDILKYVTSKNHNLNAPKLMISPHAGYVFSGDVAGNGFAVINKNIKRVFVIGPSHHVWFKGVSITEATHYETPLGKIELDRDVITMLRESSLVVCAKGADEPEHCIEVQLPFLQVQLQNFKIIPLLCGEVNAEAVAELIFPYLDETTIVIASSDLSHFHNHETARLKDDRTIQTIMAGNENGFIDGCGKTPIKVVMALAGRLRLNPCKLDARTSYETAPQYGSESRVVGYASIVYTPDKSIDSLSHTAELTGELKSYLLKLARSSLKSAVNQKTFLSDTENVPELLKENRGCFVTLKKNRQLRGCIGYIEPIKPLYMAIVDNAENAALRDPRFSPVTEKELNEITIEVSVLSKPQQLFFKTPQELLQKLTPGVHGVILNMGSYQSTFLPQVWEQLPDKIQFLEMLSMKAGMPKDGWKAANVKVYTADHFSD